MASAAATKSAAKKEFISNTTSDWFSSDDESEGGGGGNPSLQASSRQATTVPTPSSNSGNVPQQSSMDSSLSALGGKLKDILSVKDSEATINARRIYAKGGMKPVEGDDWVVIPTSSNTGSPHKQSLSSDQSVDEKTAYEITSLNNRIARMDRFRALLANDNVDLEKLKKLSWNGIPDDLRGLAWQLLMGYLPCNKERREPILLKKRNDYHDYVKQSFGKGIPSLDQVIYHQIHIDVPRTNPAIKLYQDPRIQSSLERILYCWAIRHPASGYVQGINDLATPFFQIFLSAHISSENIEAVNLVALTDELLDQVEADTFWCLSRLLDGIQDNYTHAQPGILRQIQRMKELVSRIDVPLYTHITQQGIDFIQFAFRWINCLLMRELSMTNIVRMWDTCLAEGPDGFSNFHTYICTAFLAKWSAQLRKMDFQEILLFLQALPTRDWGEKEIEMLLSEAFTWKSLFHNAPSHFSGSAGKTASEWSI